MTTERVKRKLTAILSADVKGYSFLMEDNEEATVRTITVYRELMTGLIQGHSGRVVDAKGDNVLAEFPSVVDAVRCAVEIQKELKVKNADLPEHRRMEFRIGINLGDVIEEEETIYGDGVNIAARLEGLAEGGGICISRMAFDSVKKKLDLGYEYLGEHSVKNIAEPVRVYKVLMEPEYAGKVIGEERAKPTKWRWAALVAVVAVFLVLGGIAVWKFYLRPTPITILIRMMKPQESWFMKNIIKDFENKNRCKMIIKRFEKDYETVEILRREAEAEGKNNVSLVKTPLHLTLLLYKEGLVKPFGDILLDLGFGESKIESWLRNVEDEYVPIALEMSKFSSITGERLYFLPRKLETRLMIYRKSKVVDAVKNWHKLHPQINTILREENGYGLPRNYNLEADVNKWDFYDLLVVGYYWANTQYDGKKTARIAHRSKNYFGTVIGLIDRALQLGALNEDIRSMHESSEAIMDMLHWESIFRKYNLYHKGMWEEDGWSGANIYEGIKDGSVYLAWMHQLDCLLIYGSEQLGMESYLNKKKDLGISVMPQGVSFELAEHGGPKRIGTREAHTFGWFWGIPKYAPQPELAYKLAMFITSYEPHLEESKRFFLIPIRKDVPNAVKAGLTDWQTELYDKSLEQFKINGDRTVPRFKTLAAYQKFLNRYYAAFEKIVIKKKYSQVGAEGRVDRNFIREKISSQEQP